MDFCIPAAIEAQDTREFEPYQNLSKSGRYVSIGRPGIKKILQFAEGNGVDADIYSYATGTALSLPEGVDREEWQEKNGYLLNLFGREKTLSTEEVRQLHSFTEDMMEVINDKYGIRYLDEYMYADGRPKDVIDSEDEYLAYRSWVHLIVLQKLTRIAVEYDLEMAVLRD